MIPLCFAGAANLFVPWDNEQDGMTSIGTLYI